MKIKVIGNDLYTRHKETNADFKFTTWRKLLHSGEYFCSWWMLYIRTPRSFQMFRKPSVPTNPYRLGRHKPSHIFVKKESMGVCNAMQKSISNFTYEAYYEYKMTEKN
jgi:hypothetical protein